MASAQPRLASATRTTSPITRTAGLLQPAAAEVMVPSSAIGGALAGAVAAFDDRHRHVGPHPGPAEPGREVVKGADAHQDHNGSAESGKVG